VGVNSFVGGERNPAQLEGLSRGSHMNQQLQAQAHIYNTLALGASICDDAAEVKGEAVVLCKHPRRVAHLHTRQPWKDIRGAGAEVQV
jgi:hypothetical protein